MIYQLIHMYLRKLQKYVTLTPIYLSLDCM